MNLFDDKEWHAKSLLALGQIILFANDLIDIHKSAASMLK